MSSLHEKLTEIGLGVVEVKYLKARGGGMTKWRSLNASPADGGLGMGGSKATRWMHNFVKRTGWDNDTVHIRVGTWLNTGACPVESNGKPKCPVCKGSDAEAFSLYPLEQRCDLCFSEAIAATIAAEKAAQAKRTSLGIKLAKAMDVAGFEAAEVGQISTPTLDEAMSAVAEFAGGWTAVTEILSEMLTSSSGGADRAKIALQLLDYLRERDKPTGPVIDLKALDKQPHLRRTLVDAMIAEWKRDRRMRRDRPELAEMIQHYGGKVPVKDESDVDEYDDDDVDDVEGDE